MISEEIADIFEIEMKPYPDIFHIGSISMLDALKGMVEDGVTDIEIYYAEDIEDKINWSVDVMNDYINNVCNLSWVWTVTSKSEDDLYRDKYKDNDDTSEYEMIVDEEFSDEVVCNAIIKWLREHYINNINVKMINIEDAEGSGYIANIRADLKKTSLYTEY